MKDFPSCFGENGVQVADFSSSSSSSSSSSDPSLSKATQNLVTCVYQCESHGFSYLVTVSWSKALMGQGRLTVALDDSARRHRLCKIEIKPWLFSRSKGSKNSELVLKDGKLDVHWDLSNARFGSGPEPVEGFYVAVALDQEPLLLIGDLNKEAYKKIGGAPSNSVFVSKKEHVFGKSVFECAKAQFRDKGLIHDVRIECGGGGGGDLCLTIRVDGKTAVQVKRLRWKFRGNHTILVDGEGVEVYWDVYNWLFGGDGNAAVFMFHQTSSSAAADKFWATTHSVLDSSVLTWTSSSCSNKFQFSLVLYAWKND